MSMSPSPEAPASALRKKKIAILGGGAGAMTAAFWLTKQPGWQEQYEVTVYQMGWRLGGKGASGRDPQMYNRILEHGLHIWMGCYVNAFAMMQQCYRELHRPPESPLADWDKAFQPHSLVTLIERENDQTLFWDIDFPTNPEVPGQGGEFLTLWDFVRMTLKWMVGRHDSSAHATAASARVHQSGLRRLVVWAEKTYARTLNGIETAAETVITGVETILGRQDAAPVHTSLHKAHQLAHALDADPAKHTAEQHHTIRELLEHFIEGFHHAIQHELPTHTELRRLWILLDLAAAAVRGMLADGVLYKGLDPLDKWDFREWLSLHGASEASVWSAPLEGLYDMVFGYKDGDPLQPSYGAGVGLRTIMRTVWTYKGAFCWKMQAGMGDAVFAPLYEALKQRGVKFKFFHRVENLGVSSDGSRIETINIAIQANLADDTRRRYGEYQPLVTIDGLPCWPSVPLYDQLVEGELLKRANIDLESAWANWRDPDHATLRVGKDFDEVVLGIALGALPFITTELSAANSRWRDMLTHVKTVQTQAFQIWLDRDAAELGWVSPQRAIWGNFVQSGADMSQVLAVENWPPALHVRNVSYFCSALREAEHIPPPYSDPQFPQQQAEIVKRHSLALLKYDMQPLWPQATDPTNPSGLDWNRLVDPLARQGEQRFDSQFWRANIDPSERYVLSVKNSCPYRLKSNDSGFANLYLAGDWTRNGYNAGCVEAAVISGMHASAAICGFPTKIVGEADL
jgi:uncharacterized protein with NAD-binding domain and iron-sulfur cluster